MKKTFTIFTVFLVLTTLTGAFLIQNRLPEEKEKQVPVYIGVTYCGDSINDGKVLIDKVKNYTNLFVLQSGSLQRDLESVNIIGDYAVSAGLFFLPYFSFYLQPSFSSWVEAAKNRWGTHFIGVYYSDEPGGRMLDDYVEFNDTKTGDSIMKTKYGDIAVHKPNGTIINYELSGKIVLSKPASGNGSSSSDGNALYAVFYPNGTIIANGNSLTNNQMHDGSNFITYDYLQSTRPFKDIVETTQRFCSLYKDNIEYLRSQSLKVFTSDYALYWFDYLAGYDVVLSQVGWNQTLAQDIALIRGAAKLQNKEWGAVVTWKYTKPPYLDSGTEIFNQMRIAYENGAKYIIIFNYSEETNGPYGTMKEEHFLALEHFWSDVIRNPNISQGSTKATIVLVFPKNYGGGMRWAEDKIWGIFEHNEDSHQIWIMLQNAVKDLGFNFDIVYEDAAFPLDGKYEDLHFWNQK